MKHLIIALLLCATTAIAAPERVIVTKVDDLAEVNKLLADGWVVKFQSVAAAGAGTYTTIQFVNYLVFTLSPPTDEKLKENAERDEAERKAKWERRKSEFEAKKSGEKPKTP